MNSLPCDILLSFAYYSKWDVATTRQQIGPESLMLIDSGAFTAFTLGKQINIDEYAEFLETWEGDYSYAITLDAIGDPETTERNTRKLWDRGFPVLPVFTTGESLAKFDELCKNNDYVAVGGVAALGALLRHPYCAALNQRAEANGTKLHLLGVGGKTAHVTKPFSSDSSRLPYGIAMGGAAFFNGEKVRQVRIEAMTKDDRRLWSEYLPDLIVPPGPYDRQWFIDHARSRLLAVAALSLQLYAANLRSFNSSDDGSPHLVWANSDLKANRFILPQWKDQHVPQKYLPKKRNLTK